MSSYDYYSILQGALATVSLSLISILFGLPMGLGLAILRWSNLPIFKDVAYFYVSVVRSCPTVTLTLLIFYALPQFGISFEPIPAAIFALTISTTAFNCEVWRSSLIEFPKDQLDAAYSMGLNRWDRMILVIFPQIWRQSLPGLFNEMTLQIKSTPAVAVIGIVDITRAALRVGSNTYEPLPPFIFAIIIYGLIVYAFILIQRYVEARLAHLGYL